MAYDDIKKHFQSYIIYAPENNYYKSLLENHLKLKSKELSIGILKYYDVKNSALLKRNTSEIINDTTSIIILVSFELLSSDFGLSNKIDLLVRANKLKQIKIIPIYIDHANVSNSALRHVNRLYANKIPLYEVDNQGRAAFNNHLQILSSEICQHILAAITYDHSIKKDWNESVKKNTIEGYNHFIKKHYYSKYKPFAKTKKDQLIEKDLWKKASKEDKISAYVHYLSSAPLGEHKNKAVIKIVDIESKEEKAREDINTNENLGILFDYKINFRKNGKIDEVNKKIYSVFSKPLDFLLFNETPIKSESKYLQAKIHETCTRDEIFTYHLLKEVIGSVQRGLYNLKHQLIDFKKTLFNRTFLLVLIAITMPSLLFYLSIDLTPYILIGNGTLLIIVSFILFTSVWNAARLMSKDIRSCDDKLAKIRKKMVELKIAYLINDIKRQGELVLFIYNTEDWLEGKSRKNISSYLQKLSEDQEYNSSNPKLEYFKNRLSTLASLEYENSEE